MTQAPAKLLQALLESVVVACIVVVDVIETTVVCAATRDTRKQRQMVASRRSARE